ncbi:LacI family DNA-binding transcriptional regulator [Jiella sp. M17.18]|uniref:LacI family DNA-binding transcriptional regulator n=1 Tax=Jiella sp. M17.18 TaxID=3234247 RepID=UPI0034E023A2
MSDRTKPPAEPIAGRPAKQARVATADDVASLAGVSRSAVSRTFTPGASVAPQTRERVLEAAEALGYRVNFLARSLSQQRTNLVGLIVSDMDNPFRERLVDQIARALIRLDYRPFFLPSSPDEDTRHLIDMVLHYNLSGAIVTCDASPDAIAEACAAQGVPLVLVNKPEAAGRIDNVSLDADKAGSLAAQALCEAGCRRIGLAGQRRHSHTIALRRDAFLRACATRGMAVVGTFYGAAQNYEGGLEAARDFLGAGIALDGIYCANDYLALGFLDQLRHTTQLRVPEDLKLVACDDIPQAEWLSYRLTTIRQDTAALAKASVAALIQRIADPGAPHSQTVVDVTLVRRESTRQLGEHG